MTPFSSVVMSDLIDGITINAMPHLTPVPELSETTQDPAGEALFALLDPSHPDDHSTDDLVKSTVASNDRENKDDAPIAAENDGKDDDDAPVAEDVEDGAPDDAPIFAEDDGEDNDNALIAEDVEDGPPIDPVDWSIEGVE